jgi:hypothetical protein
MAFNVGEIKYSIVSAKRKTSGIHVLKGKEWSTMSNVIKSFQGGQ